MMTALDGWIQGKVDYEQGGIMDALHDDGLTGCVTDGDPTILHCFPAYGVDLEPEHRETLDEMALTIRNGDLSGKRVRKVRLVGYAATWGKTTETEYLTRSITRAKNVRNHLRERLSGYMLSYWPAITVEGRGDSEPLRDNMVKSTTSTAQRNRALNRRVEIFLVQGKAPKRIIPKRERKTDWDAFLNSKLKKLEGFWETDRPLDGDRVHTCIRRKLLRPHIKDIVVQPIGRVGSYQPPESGPYVPEHSLRSILINDLKKGYARGPIKRFDRRFNLHVENVILGLSDLGFRATGTDIYDRGITRAMRRATRWSEDKRHIYSCSYFVELIDRINTQDPF
jgi:hypothetical protein